MVIREVPLEKAGRGRCTQASGRSSTLNWVGSLWRPGRRLHAAGTARHWLHRLRLRRDKSRPAASRQAATKVDLCGASLKAGPLSRVATRRTREGERYPSKLASEVQQSTSRLVSKHDERCSFYTKRVGCSGSEKEREQEGGRGGRERSHKNTSILVSFVYKLRDRF